LLASYSYDYSYDRQPPSTPAPPLAPLDGGNDAALTGAEGGDASEQLLIVMVALVAVAGLLALAAAALFLGRRRGMMQMARLKATASSGAGFAPDAEGQPEDMHRV
tara:strand:- start:43 stop:360 length:318 start_codon:yes stop_codon:yes gene_type:complete